MSKKIAANNADLTALYSKRSLGLNSAQDDQDISKMVKLKRKWELELDTLERDRKRKKADRDNKKSALQQIATKYPETKDLLNIHDTTGRPRLESQQPGLMQAIIDIATHGSATDDKRRTEMMKYCSTLDELADKIGELGYTIKRSALYLRLIPRNSLTTEGKRHVNVVPVKLARPQNNQHKSHIDGFFCTANNRFVEQLASVLGPDQVAYISQDDKARVPIGITAAHKQSSFLMHVEYKVSLPDHDFVKGGRHKLIPSVIAGITIKPNGTGDANDVTYSGPTFISIRSGKHDSSNASTHAWDFRRILELPEFEKLLKYNDLVKPVIIKNCDGGPDENCRYIKVINLAIHDFVKYDLDALFIVSNAPGRSAYNRVERRMAPLSKELAGVVLPHDTFGTHLDNSGKTIDAELEVKNFNKAGEILKEIWSDLTFDDYPVVSEYIEPGKGCIADDDIIKKSDEWVATHVRSSQYFLQIVRCEDRKCCKPFRSSINQILQNRFIQAPLPLKNDSSLIITKESNAFGNLFLNELLHKEVNVSTAMSYDQYCPSVADKVKTRTCTVCNLYFASLTLLKNHAKIHKKNKLLQSTSQPLKVRPERIAAKRAKEFLVALNKEKDEFEWLDEDLVETVAVNVKETLSSEELKEYDLSKYLNPIWILE